MYMYIYMYIYIYSRKLFTALNTHSLKGSNVKATKLNVFAYERSVQGSLTPVRTIFKKKYIYIYIHTHVYIYIHICIGNFRNPCQRVPGTVPEDGFRERVLAVNRHRLAFAWSISQKITATLGGPSTQY